jgi:hypothetical protein
MFFTRTRPGHMSSLLVVAAFALISCGGGGGNHGSGSAYAVLNWNIFDVAGITPLDCVDVGAGSLDVIMANQATGKEYKDTILCSSPNYEANTIYVPAGDYIITIKLFSDATLYGDEMTEFDEISSPMTLLSGPNDLGTVDFNVNSFVLDWYITDGGLEATCAEVGGYTVELDVLFQGQTTPTVYSFACDLAPQATMALQLGTYAIQWQTVLLDANNRELTTYTPAKNFNVINPLVATQRVQADLGYVTFAF